MRIQGLFLESIMCFGNRGKQGVVLTVVLCSRSTSERRVLKTHLPAAPAPEQRGHCDLIRSMLGGCSRSRCPLRYHLLLRILCGRCRRCCESSVWPRAWRRASLDRLQYAFRPRCRYA
jgi:hypothetical protein